MGLDLSLIDAWTRGMLEAEARRRGIRGPEFRTRGDLIRLILRHQYGGRLNAARDRIAQARTVMQQAREVVSLGVGTAISILPDALDLFTRVRGQVPLPKSAAPKRARPSSVPVQTPVPAAAPSPTSTSAPASSTPPAPTTRTFVEEPIRTRSMARLLVAQGHRERALAIYEELLARNSADQGLRDELAAVRRGEPVAAAVLPEPPLHEHGVTGAVLPDSGDRVSCRGEASAGFDLEWHVTDRGVSRARAVLGHDGELVARIISIRPDPDRVVRSEITEHGPLPVDGGWRTPPMPGAARCVAAIGLRHDECFVAIAHTQPSARDGALAAQANAGL